MAGLPRSEVSFRRQGSSGSVWDDKFLRELNKMKPEVETTDQQEAGQDQKQEGVNDTKKPKESSPSAQTVYKTTNVPSPSIDPPSPKVSGCGLCGPFAKSEKKTTHKRKTAGNKRKS